MSPLFEVNEKDRLFYEKRLKEFLPERIIDIHTHVWLTGLRKRMAGTPAGLVSWPLLVARENPVEDLIETYKLMFPDKKVVPLIFSNIYRDDDIDVANGYIVQCSEKHGFPSLIYAAPWWSAEELERKVMEGGFLGLKVYLDMSEPYIPAKEIRIFDFLPHHQLEIINRHGWIVMLHIPRDGRLKDPVNLAQMLEIERRYPAIKLIIAHVGRAYCDEDVGNAFEVLSETKNMLFDFSANTNRFVFTQLIRTVGPKRILFGSDLPILRMRTRRICENGNYINLVPKGLYGDVSGDRHMREVAGEEADELTFFLYEEIDAFCYAAEAAGLHKPDIEDIFFNNASKIFHELGYTV